MTISRRLGVLLATGAVALTSAPVASCAPKASASTASKIAALKELRDSGVITSEQYDQRVAQLGAAGSRSGAPTPVSLPLGGGGKQEHVIDDPQLGMAAFKVTAPRGWRVQGRTSHDAGCSVPQDFIEWSAESPDGLQGLNYSSGLKYGAVSIPQIQQQMQSKGCVMLPSTDAGDVLRKAYLPQAYPGARIISVTPIPASDPRHQTLQKALDAAQAQAQPQRFMQNRVTLNGAEARIAYQRDGHALEADVAAFAMCIDTRMQMPTGPGMETLDCTLGPLMVTHAPPGQVDRLIADANLVSFDDLPAYDQRVSDIRAEQARQAMDKTLADGRQALAQQQAQTQSILAQGQANVAAIQQRGASIVAQGRARSAAYDQSNQAFVRYLGGQAQYTDTNGQTFNASNQYSHTYVDGNGHVVQSNSAYGPGAGWTETQGR